MRWIVLFLVTFAPTAGHAAEKLPQDRVNQLVQQLGSPSRRDREQAEEQLSSADPDVLDRLPRSSRDAAVSTALDRVRRTLEQSAARRAGLASTVSLQGQQSSSEIEAAILRQTGQAVMFGNGQRGPLEIDWKNISLWNAVHQLEVQTKTVASGDRFAEALVLQPLRDGVPAPVATSSGPCRVEIVSAAPRPNLVDPSMALLQVRWRVRAEPRLRPLYLISADRDCTLTDGLTRFAPLSPDARREIPCERWEGCEVDTAFQVPATLDASKLQFSADAKLKVAALPQKLRFSDLQLPVPTPQQRGAVTGVVRNIHEDRPSKSLAFDIAVAYEHGGPEFESHRMWIYQNAGWLEQKAGNKIVTPEIVELKEIGATGATLRYGFENVPGALNELAFVYEAPSLVIDVPISVKGLTVSKVK